MATPKQPNGNRRKSATKRASGAASASTAAPSKTSKRTQSAKRSASGSQAPKTAAGGASRARAAGSAASAGSKNGSARSARSAGRRTAGSQNGSARGRASTRARAAQPHDGVVESVKHAGASAVRAASRAGAPTLTVAAAVAGIAGGLIMRRPKPPMRDGLGARSRDLLHDIDPTSVIEGIGKASMLVSRRGKSFARDLDQVADRAERLGKVLR